MSTAVIKRKISDARMLVVGNYRDVEVDRAHPLAKSLADCAVLPTTIVSCYAV